MSHRLFVRDRQAISIPVRRVILESPIRKETVVLACPTPPRWDPSTAQEVGDPPPSVVPVLGIADRVRVSVGGVRIVGEVAGATLEGFEFVQGGVRRSFAFSEIDDPGAERWDAVSRALGRVARGFFGGILVKGAIDGCLDNGGDGELDCIDGNEALLWGGGGALLGAAAGFLIRFEVWESVLPGGDRWRRASRPTRRVPAYCASSAVVASASARNASPRK